MLVAPILIALGISVVYATTRIFHLAHGVVILFAAYVFWWLYGERQLPFFFVVIGAVLAAILTALVMNEFVYEKLRGRGTKGLGYLIATLALLMLGTGFILGVFGAAPKTLKLQPQIFTFGGVNITSFQVFDLATVIILALTFVLFMKKTKLGKAMRATADNEVVAEVFGVNTRRIRALAFSLSGLLAASAGILSTLHFAIDPNASVLYAVRGFTATLIGGVGSILGTIIGALIIALSEQAVVWFLGAGWRNAATFLILFLFLLFRPQGIFGGKREA